MGMVLLVELPLRELGISPPSVRRLVFCREIPARISGSFPSEHGHIYPAVLRRALRTAGSREHLVVQRHGDWEGSGEPGNLWEM